MKNYISLTTTRLTIIVSLGVIIGFISCKKENTEDTSPPVIDAVTYLKDRGNELAAVNYGEWIMLKGKHLASTFKVDFNSVLAADSLIYADDTSVTVKIPHTLPEPKDNPITVTTRYGSYTYKFNILQPAPELVSFEPMAGVEGETITINGSFFSGLTSVKFGDKVAVVESSSKTEIKVKVPAGVTAENLFVTTVVGTVKSARVFGFKYVVYDDALASTWYSSPWSGTTTQGITTPVRRGANGVKHEYLIGFAGGRFSKNAPALSLAGYTGVKISIYGGPGTAGKKIRIQINGTGGYTVLMTEGSWTDYQIPFTNLGNPTTLSSVTFQEFSNLKPVIYVDDIGLY